MRGGRDGMSTETQCRAQDICTRGCDASLQDQIVMPAQFRSKSLASKLPLSDKVALLIPKLKLCLLQSKYCLHWTPCQAMTGRQITGIRPCRTGASGCAGVTWQWHRVVFDLDLYAGQLAMLKEDLRTALDQVEAHQAEAIPIIEQASRLSLEELEKELTLALDEVRRMKLEQRRRSNE
jgi:hypothetical protein